MASPTSSSMNGYGGGKNEQLAELLRACAHQVERNELGPVVVQTLGALTAYIQGHGGEIAATPSSISRGKGMGDEKPFDESPHKPSVFAADASADFEVKDRQSQQPSSTKHSRGHHLNFVKEFTKKVGLGDRKGGPSSFRSESSKGNRANADLADAAIENKVNAAAASAASQDAPEGTGSTGGEYERTMHSASPIPTVSASSSPSLKPASPTRPTQRANPAKPSFQRPVNPSSTLIANGWIEQQRRSKMRHVWKDILASLVEGRKPGEETTLWIQRQVTDPTTNKVGLEALHQIPMKWLERVTYVDYSGDHRFSIKVYNVTEEFLFRCADEESAQNWVLTLRSVSQTDQEQMAKIKRGEDPNDALGLDNLKDWDDNVHTKESKEEPEPQAQPPQQAQPTNHRMTVRELRAIAHGSGYNTSGMERTELEDLVKQISQSGMAKEKEAAVEEQRRRMAAQQEQQQAHYQDETLLRKQKEEEQRLFAEQRRRQEEEEQERLMAEQRRRQEEDEEHQRLMAEQRRKQKEDEQRQRLEEEHRQRMAEQQAAEGLRRRQMEEEQRRRIAEQQAAEQRRRQAQAEEERRRLAEQQAAAARQRQAQMDEEQRKKQAAWQAAQWQQQQAQQAAQARAQWEQQWKAQQQQQQHGQYYAQQQQTQQQHPQQQGAPPYYSQGPQTAPPAGAPHPGQYQQQPSQGHPATPQQPQRGGAPPPPQNHPASPADMKYAKMAEPEADDGAVQASITVIKRNILVHWALQPPTLQMLRPIDMLLTSIHTVFPPAFGVSGHEYFKKWKPITRESLVLSAAMGNSPDEEKLKKAVRKLRFFLHPDKTPRDLNEEQKFMVKMLWDVTSDAWEEHHKQKEELSWIH